jgi:glucuronokinase
MIICKRVGARVGLIGNPSDGFGGKTIASLISDFSASVILWESPKIEIIAHPVFDPMSFGSLEDLFTTANFDGYYGGLRLVYATCKKFYQWCAEAGIKLERRNFSIQYDTTIPRQVGLAGSSAIVTATLKALMEFYGLGDGDIPLPLQPNLVLSVETEELGIAAGLQDRVVQVYGGLVYMDFAPDYVSEHGHGNYERLSVSLLPPLYLAYTLQPSDSGKIHSTVRYRFGRGERDVIEGMRRLAELTDAAREALEARDYESLGCLMNENFDVRRRIYGDNCIGTTNLRMIELARSLGLPAKFPGSGGAIVGLYLDEEQFLRAEKAFTDEGFMFRRIHPSDSLLSTEDEVQMHLERLQQLRHAVRAGVPRASLAEAFA